MNCGVKSLLANSEHPLSLERKTRRLYSSHQLLLDVAMTPDYACMHGVFTRRSYDTRLCMHGVFTIQTLGRHFLTWLHGLSHYEYLVLVLYGWVWTSRTESDEGESVVWRVNLKFNPGHLFLYRMWLCYQVSHALLLLRELLEKTILKYSPRWTSSHCIFHYVT